MTVESDRRITYRGPPSGASALVHMLKNQGVHVEWEPPIEEPGGDHVEDIILALVASGSDDAIKFGLRQFHARCGGGGAEAVIEADQASS